MTATGITVRLSDNYEYSAGIGCYGKQYNTNNWSAEITINGGVIEATGGGCSAGIGGSFYASDNSACTVTIYGGTVTSTGGAEYGSGGAGIGGGYKKSGGTLTIYGGTVTATGGGSAAGIGSGTEGNGGTVTIYGGTVTATGGTDGGAGIGGGYFGSGGTVEIHGGEVIATGGSSAAGIGGGAVGSGGTVTVTGGTITATGKGGAGIGGGFYKSGGTVTVTGGTITASGGQEGIGRGVFGDSSGTLTLGSGMYLYKDSVEKKNAVRMNASNDYQRDPTMIVNNTSPHTHNLTYSGSETAVTAACNGNMLDFCDFPLVDGQHVATLTIVAPEKGGDPATLAEDVSGAFGLEGKTFTYSYQTRNGNGTWPESSNSTPPNADGFHKASVTYVDPNGGTHPLTVTYGLNCITYNTAENGTVSGTANAAVGATITPTITPSAAWYELDTLTVTKKGDDSVAVDVTDNKSFVMPDYDVTVSATFKPKQFNITSDLTNGTMTAKVNDETVTTAAKDANVVLTITPDAGYTVNTVSVKDSAEGSVDVSDENGSYSFTMPASDVTVTATYNAIDYNVSVSGSIAHGTVMPSKTSGAHVGETITLTMTPDNGYTTDSVSVTYGENATVSVAKTDDNTYTFEMPANAVTVSATFTAIDYSVTIAESTNGTVTTATTGAVHIGDKITLTVTPAEDYGVKAITTSSGTLVQTALNPETGVATYELTMGAGDATVTAEFAELTTYTVFYNASGSPDAVSVRLAGDTGNGYDMKNNAKFGDLNCWSTQIRAGVGIDSLSLSIKVGDADWASLNIPVVTDLTAPEKGAAVAIAGESNAFVVAFVWGENTATQSRYYLVTSNTESISVPNPADTASEIFSGWTYLVPASEQGAGGEAVTVNKAASGDSTTVQLGEIKQTTIVNAIWTPKTYTVRFNPDNGSEVTTQTVTYGSAGSAITLPDTPTKAGHEFVGWVLAKTAVEKVGNETSQFPAGTEFDFANTTIINDLSLKAKWRHVHSYVCLQLDDDVFGDAFKDFYGYKGQLHIKLCTSMDDYTVEAHSFVNGKCACGASILDDKVTLTQYVGDTENAIKAIRNSFVSISAPQKSGSQTFSKWQYSFNATTKDDGSWTDLTSARSIAFAIPNNMSTRAVYENETAKLSIRSFKYDNSHVAFQFDYSVPEGYTVVDGGLMWGDNVRMKFWDCTIKSFLGSQYEPSLRDAVSVFGGGTIASKMYNYQTINEPGLATPLEKPLKSFGRTGTVAVAWQPYTSDGYKNAIRAGAKVDGYNQSKYPTYAMGYIICKHGNGYVGFMTNAISATLERPSASHVAQILVSG